MTVFMDAETALNEASAVRCNLLIVKNEWPQRHFSLEHARTFAFQAASTISALSQQRDMLRDAIEAFMLRRADLSPLLRDEFNKAQSALDEIPSGTIGENSQGELDTERDQQGDFGAEPVASSRTGAAAEGKERT